MIRGLLPQILTLLLLVPGQVLADAAAPLDLEAYDPDNAQDIMELCAGCHGEYGQGGGDGEYPHLAGMPAAYLVAQLEDFKTRERLNIPMLPFATDRELPAEDIRDISIHLSRLELLTRMPDVPEETSSYERLLIAGRVFNVARLEGDLARGRRVLKNSCAKCHGKEGEGRARVPQLAGQYSKYIRVQIELIVAGERKHPDIDEYFGPHDADDWDALLAHLSTLDD